MYQHSDCVQVAGNKWIFCMIYTSNGTYTFDFVVLCAKVCLARHFRFFFQKHITERYLVCQIIIEDTATRTSACVWYGTCARNPDPGNLLNPQSGLNPDRDFVAKIQKSFLIKKTSNISF